MKLVTPRNPTAVEHALASSRQEVPTYTGTHNGEFADTTDSAVIGYGIVAFRAAREGLRTWRAHQLPGLHVFPGGEPVVEGGTYLLTFGTPLLAIAAPCRVTAVRDEPWAYGFTYATLPGHPEVGEETFELVLRDEEVHFSVQATSKPASALAGTFVARHVQRTTARRYVEALARHVRRSTPLP